CFAALESPMKQKTWFVADGDIYSSNDFSKLIQEVLQKKRVLSIRVPLIIVQVLSTVSEALSRLTGKPSLLNRDKYNVMKQRNWTCDASELKQDLNFKPEYNLRQGLEEALDWYKKNGWL
ncbi:MAG: NAD(P)-dependent oxidoreductase, partial [Bacteroidia bacterium]|nr:NAD(P)-dependent oxidoreductase [Bacteroidia bacterium]